MTGVTPVSRPDYAGLAGARPAPAGGYGQVRTLQQATGGGNGGYTHAAQPPSKPVMPFRYPRTPKSLF